MRNSASRIAPGSLPVLRALFFVAEPPLLPSRLKSHSRRPDHLHFPESRSRADLLQPGLIHPSPLGSAILVQPPATQPRPPTHPPPYPSRPSSTLLARPLDPQAGPLQPGICILPPHPRPGLPLHGLNTPGLASPSQDRSPALRARQLRPPHPRPGLPPRVGSLAPRASVLVLALVLVAKQRICRRDCAHLLRQPGLAAGPAQSLGWALGLGGWRDWAQG